MDNSFTTVYHCATFTDSSNETSGMLTNIRPHPGSPFHTSCLSARPALCFILGMISVCLFEHTYNVDLQSIIQTAKYPLASKTYTAIMVTHIHI